jgi:cytochrome c oxidase assembly protein subunit 11
MSRDNLTTTLNRSNRKVAAVCVCVFGAMIGLAYASVPLYQMFCQMTGYAGTTQRAKAPAARILDRTVTVRFDATVSPGLPWQVAAEKTATLKIGETGVAIYRATNTSDRAVTGTAAFNVTPDQAGVFFNKLECFCFTEQRIEPGQTVELPVSYFVDPAIADDVTTAKISDITLSYTFFTVAAPKAVAAIKPESAKSSN